MSDSTACIGFWAAILSALFGTCFSAVALLANFTALLPSAWVNALSFAPSILLAWCYLVLMACVLDAAPPNRKVWAMLGFGFALLYSTINSIVYFVQLVVVIPRVLRNEGQSVALLLFEPQSFMLSMNGLAYGLMSIAALFASGVFTRPSLESITQRTMQAHGLLAPFIVGAVVWPQLTYIGSLWIVTFPAMTISLGLFFRRSQARQSASNQPLQWTRR